MSTALSVPEFPRLNPAKTGFFRFRRLKDDYLITNDFGRHSVLTAPELTSFVEGSI